MIMRQSIIALFASICSMIPCQAQKHQHGKASYYSKKATGARTASGQKIHHDSLTCAHRYFPFGTMLKVTNLSNNKSVIVKVIDRGPFGRGRIIDLSWGAAKEIGMLSQGVCTVKVERLDNPVPYKPEDTILPKIDFEMAEFEPLNNYKKNLHNYNNIQKVSEEKNEKQKAITTKEHDLHNIKAELHSKGKENEAHNNKGKNSK